MKKLILLFLFVLPVYADYSSYCSIKTPSKSPSGVIMSVSGFNFLARKIAQSEIKKALKKETNSDFKVKLNSFWGTNITHGEISSFSAEAKNYQDKNFSSQKLTLQTTCPYNKISYKNDKLNFDTNIILKFDAEVNEEDLSKMLKQKVWIENNKIAFSYKVSALGFKVSMKIKAGLEVADNKIQLCNIETKNKSIDASKYLSLLNLTNFTLDIDKNTSTQIKVEGVNIKNSLVYLSGYAIIPQN